MTVFAHSHIEFVQVLVFFISVSFVLVLEIVGVLGAGGVGGGYGIFVGAVLSLR